MIRALRLLLPLLIVLACMPAASARHMTADDAAKRLSQLDKALDSRYSYISQRQGRIDSLTRLLAVRPADLDLHAQIIEGYTAFNNDSALSYTDRAIALAGPGRDVAFRLKRATLMPLAALFEGAIEEFESINPDSLPPGLAATYYDSGRQMYSYIASFYDNQPNIRHSFRQKEEEMRLQLIDVLPDSTDIWRLNMGEHYKYAGDNFRAKAMLEALADNPEADMHLRARASHLLSALALQDDDTDTYVYRLASSAYDDARAATREVISLQELGAYLHTRGDVERAYVYLSTALANAVECGAVVRQLESSRAMPLIEGTYNRHQNRWYRIIYIIGGILCLLVVALIIMQIRLHKNFKRIQRMQQSLRQANKIKDTYISQFLNLCSIYMDKLVNFSKIVERKISTGKVDDLYRITKSGKLVEEQSREFYDVFDNAFLHIYPTFVTDVNRLLRPDAQIELKPGELLNTDLRILAFMRLGIDDSSRISQILNYSVNTIYAYRNRMRARAINRDTFEADIQRIGAPE